MVVAVVVLAAAGGASVAAAAGAAVMVAAAVATVVAVETAEAAGETCSQCNQLDSQLCPLPTWPIPPPLLPLLWASKTELNTAPWALRPEASPRPSNDTNTLLAVCTGGTWQHRGMDVNTRGSRDDEARH